MVLVTVIAVGVAEIVTTALTVAVVVTDCTSVLVLVAMVVDVELMICVLVTDCTSVLVLVAMVVDVDLMIMSCVLVTTDVVLMMLVTVVGTEKVMVQEATDVARDYDLWVWNNQHTCSDIIIYQ